ncbi:hypothetical protein BJ742DRAFT_766428 [Cladochytrium replicatum]|nr:hypothetical protein BJ742DRAFT_766428 [Cladochytrium replicatum]
MAFSFPILKQNEIATCMREKYTWQRNSATTKSPIALQRSEQEPQVVKLKEVNSKLIEELRELNSVKKVLSDETDELKKGTKGPEEKLAITELNSSVVNEKANLANVEKRIREQQNKLDAMGSVEQPQNHGRLRNGAAEVLWRCAKLTAEKEAIESKNAELNDLEMTLQQQKKLLKRAQEMVVRQQKHQQLKRGTQEQRMEELRREYTKACEDKRANQTKVDGHNYPVAVLEEKIAELKREMEQEAGFVAHDFLELKTNLESYQRSLMQHLVAGLG